MNPLCFCPPPLNHRDMRLAMCFLFALFLPKNETPDPNPKRFAEAIAKEGAFPSLTEIALGGNPVSDEAKKAVKAMLQTSKAGNSSRHCCTIHPPYIAVSAMDSP